MLFLAPSATASALAPDVLNYIVDDLLAGYDYESEDESFGVRSNDDEIENMGERNVKTENDGNLSDLDDEQLDALDKEAKSNGSENSEKWAMKKFTDYLQKRNVFLDLALVEPEDLAKTVRKFYAEIRTKDGKYFAPGSLRGIRAGLHRIITAPPYNRTINIIVDTEFNLANKMMENMSKKYVSEKSEKPSHYPAIEEGDLVKVAQYLS